MPESGLILGYSAEEIRLTLQNRQIPNSESDIAPGCRCCHCCRHTRRRRQCILLLIELFSFLSPLTAWQPEKNGIEKQKEPRERERDGTEQRTFCPRSRLFGLLCPKMKSVSLSVCVWLVPSGHRTLKLLPVLRGREESPSITISIQFDFHAEDDRPD